MTNETDYAVEVNLFIRTPEGFDGHLKLTGVPYRSCIKTVADLSLALLERGFVYSPKAGGGKPASVPQEEEKSGVGPAPACQFCKGEVWDNRGDKPSAKSPDFKCKKKDCGAAAWIKDDGSLNWKK